MCAWLVQHQAPPSTGTPNGAMNARSAIFVPRAQERRILVPLVPLAPSTNLLHRTIARCVCQDRTTTSKGSVPVSLVVHQQPVSGIRPCVPVWVRIVSSSPLMDPAFADLATFSTMRTRRPTIAIPRFRVCPSPTLTAPSARLEMSTVIVSRNRPVRPPVRRVAPSIQAPGCASAAMCRTSTLCAVLNAVPTNPPFKSHLMVSCMTMAKSGWCFL